MLGEKQYRMTVMFLTEMLQWIGYWDILVMDPYPSLTDDKEYKYATNIM
jgi:hypothetical protein